MTTAQQIMALIHEAYQSMNAFYIESGLTPAELAHILLHGPAAADHVQRFQLSRALHLSIDKLAVGLIVPEKAVKHNQPLALENVVGELIFRLHDQPLTLDGCQINPDVLYAFQNDLEQALAVARRRQAKYGLPTQSSLPEDK